MTATITQHTMADLMAKVREVAAEHPHHVYYGPTEGPDGESAGCFYHKDINGKGIATCGCLIGRALKLLGIPGRVIKASKMSIGTRLRGPEVGDDLHLYLLADEQVLDWVAEAQSRQDQFVEWGACIEQADLAHPEALAPF